MSLQSFELFNIVRDYLNESVEKIKARKRALLNQLVIAMRILRRKMFLKIDRDAGSTSLVFYDDSAFAPDDHILLFVHPRHEAITYTMPSFDRLYRRLGKMPIKEMKQTLKKYYFSK